jgi:hypothetical protein
MKWGIKYLTDWRDYWDWDDWDNWQDDTPIRFDSQEEADKYIMDMCIDSFVKKFDEYERSLSRGWLNSELYRMRQEALENAGLINHPFKSKNEFYPLIGTGGVKRKPAFNRDKFKSVPDSEMSEPVERPEDMSDLDWKYAKWNPNGY